MNKRVRAPAAPKVAADGLDDITELRRQEAIFRAGALQNAIFNSANFSSIATDAKGVIQIFNVGAERMLGYSAAEVINKITPAEISDPQEVIARANALSIELDTLIAPGFEALVFKASRGIEDIYELTYIRKDGSRFPAVVSVTALRDAQDAVIGYLLIGTDNTARKEAEDLKTKLSNEMEIIIDSIPGPVFYKDTKNRFVRVNKFLADVMGLNKSEMEGKDCFDLYPHEQAQSFWEDDLEVIKSVVPKLDINEHYETAAGPGWLITSKIPYLDRSGKCIGIIGVSLDNTARKQAEEALLKGAPLQSAIFNSANFSIIATDAKGVIQIFNVGAERMLGYTAAEVMNKITPAEISDPQEVIARATTLSAELSTAIAPGFEALVFKASRGIEDIYELTYIRKDGSRFPAVVSVTALRDAQDAVIGYLLIGTDNTARKQAEEALLRAGALQNAIFNSANFSSIATDAKGVIQIFNVGAERMLGYSAAEVMNKITPAEISDPLEVIARAEALSVELSTPIKPGFEALVFKASRGIEDIYELTYIRKDGSRFPAVVSVTALRDAQDAVIGYLLIGTDNTARKQIEAEQKQLGQRLRDHQFYTRSLFESNIDALMTTDLSGIITDVNKQMEALTDCTRDELIGAPFKSYFVDQNRAETSIKLVLIHKKLTNYELTIRNRDGKEIIVSFNATTFYDRDRKLQGVFAAARDVTERKRLDQDLQERNVELALSRDAAEAANIAKSDFLSTMSHELRTPMNAIIGFSEVLRDGLLGEMPPKQKEYVNDIFSSGTHLLLLINDILDLSKVEAGQMTLDREPLKIGMLIQEALQVVRERAVAQRINLIVDIADDMPDAWLDRRKVKQVLYNLISNAVKFTPEGGEVRIVACCVVLDGNFDNYLKLAVSDTGIGISEADQQQLFKPFSQIDGTLARRYEGTGLGLAMVKRLVELHEGVVTLQSAPNKGSTFTVLLPWNVDAKSPLSLKGIPTRVATRKIKDTANKPALGRNF